MADQGEIEEAGTKSREQEEVEVIASVLLHNNYDLRSTLRKWLHTSPENTAEIKRVETAFAEKFKAAAQELTTIEFHTSLFVNEHKFKTEWEKKEFLAAVSALFPGETFDHSLVNDKNVFRKFITDKYKDEPDPVQAFLDAVQKNENMSELNSFKFYRSLDVSHIPEKEEQLLIAVKEGGINIVLAGDRLLERKKYLLQDIDEDTPPSKEEIAALEKDFRELLDPMVKALRKKTGLTELNGQELEAWAASYKETPISRTPIKLPDPEIEMTDGLKQKAAEFEADPVLRELDEKLRAALRTKDTNEKEAFQEWRHWFVLAINRVNMDGQQERDGLFNVEHEWEARQIIEEVPKRFSAAQNEKINELVKYPGLQLAYKRMMDSPLKARIQHEPLFRQIFNNQITITGIRDPDDIADIKRLFEAQQGIKAMEEARSKPKKHEKEDDAKEPQDEARLKNPGENKMAWKNLGEAATGNLPKPAKLPSVAKASPKDQSTTQVS